MHKYRVGQLSAQQCILPTADASLPHPKNNPALCLSCHAQVEKCKAAAAKKLTQPSNGNKVAGGTQRVEGYNVAYVGNIAYDATREDLMAMFK